MLHSYSCPPGIFIDSGISGDAYLCSLFGMLKTESLSGIDITRCTGRLANSVPQ